MTSIKHLPVLLCLLYSFAAKAQVSFQSPIQGVVGKDYWIVNYVDHDAGINVLADNECGNKTYDGHEGTDFVLKSFVEMDNGVDIYAAADGIVFLTKDSLFDRSKQKNSLGLGNYVAINHSDTYFAYYGHLKKYSLTVKVGDTVKAGQKIGQVGSSGNSTDPHLHLEVYDINSVIVDPFSGSCQTNASVWTTQPAYDTSLLVIDYGMSRYVPNLDTLRERYNAYQKKFTPSFSNDDTINFWIELQGIRKGDTQRVDWCDMFGIVRSTFSYITPQDYWYYYFWTYIRSSALDGINRYTAKYYINNQKEAEYDFLFTSLGVSKISTLNKITTYPNPCTDKLYLPDNKSEDILRLYSTVGSLIQEYPANTTEIDVSELAAGVYLLRKGNAAARVVKQ